MNITHTNNRPNLGYVIWPKVPRKCFTEVQPRCVRHFKERIRSTIYQLKSRHVSHIRLGVPWAECFSPGSKDCVYWYLKEFAKAKFTILPCLCFTPPELSINGMCNAPPMDPEWYALHCYEVCAFCNKNNIPLTHVEHWNEFTMDTDWDYHLDPDFSIFSKMIASGCTAVQHFEVENVLGGMAGVDAANLQILETLFKRGLMQHIDVIGFHALRGTWSDQNPPPSLPDQARRIASIISSDHVWLTAYGFPTTTIEVPKPITQWHLEEIQVALYADALLHLWEGRLERAYWYALRDSRTPTLRAITKGWEDNLKFYLGDSYLNGKSKLLGKLLLCGGPYAVVEYAKKRLDVEALVAEASLRRKQPKQYDRGTADLTQAA